MSSLATHEGCRYGGTERFHKSYDRMIGEALDSAKCIVVLWSNHSVTSDWVKDEAQEGNRRGVLIPASIEDVRLPLGFRQLQTANLVGCGVSRLLLTYLVL
jgi:hypothetical protein